MLYDHKRWDKPEVKAAPSFEGLLAWAESQPANRKYDWMDCYRCFVGRYLREAHGIEDPSGEIIYSDLFPNSEMYHAVAEAKPWTFGAALERARKFV